MIRIQKCVIWRRPRINCKRAEIPADVDWWMHLFVLSLWMCGQQYLISITSFHLSGCAVIFTQCHSMKFHSSVYMVICDFYRVVKSHPPHWQTWKLPCDCKHDVCRFHFRCGSDFPSFSPYSHSCIYWVSIPLNSSFGLMAFMRAHWLCLSHNIHSDIYNS